VGDQHRQREQQQRFDGLLLSERIARKLELGGYRGLCCCLHRGRHRRPIRTITANRSVSPIFPTFGFVQNGTISRSVLVETQ
jgi:hypothetical protein